MSQQYNEDYKGQAVAKAKASGNISQTARELTVHAFYIEQAQDKRYERFCADLL